MLPGFGWHFSEVGSLNKTLSDMGHRRIMCFTGLLLSRRLLIMSGVRLEQDLLSCLQHGLGPTNQ